jgi:hypothetical protein
MYRCIAVGLAFMPAIAALPAAKKPPPQTAAAVKLWVDSSSGIPCEQSNPASGDWMIRNNEDRNVLVTVHRTLTKGGATKEDQMRDTLGPRESRELGCEISEDGHQTLTLVRAIF